MSTMTLSPIQHDYVTKGEFKSFQTHVDGKFDKIDAEFIKVRTEFKEEFKKQRRLLNKDYNRHTGMILEKFQDNFKVAVEYITGKSAPNLFQK